jgi:hypothetical protein
MAATDPEFARTRAVECLWDCDPGVRAFGITRVELESPEVEARLRAMACDWAEDADVQHAACSRLDS